MKINWLNTIVYLGMFMIGGLFCWWLVKYMCIGIALIMMSL